MADARKVKEDSIAKVNDEHKKATLAVEDKRRKFVMDSVASVIAEQNRKAKVLADLKKAKDDSIAKIKEEQRKSAVAFSEARKKFLLDSLTAAIAAQG